MGSTLVFKELDASYVSIVNSWYHDTDSSYVEELTEQFVDYATTDPNYYAWIVFLDNVAICSVSYEIEDQIAYISIIVRPEYRGQGYGKRIIEQVKERPEIKATQKIVAGIKHSNKASVGFFQSLGFVAEGSEVDNDGFIDYYFEIK